MWALKAKVEQDAGMPMNRQRMICMPMDTGPDEHRGFQVMRPNDVWLDEEHRFGYEDCTVHVMDLPFGGDRSKCPKRKCTLKKIEEQNKRQALQETGG